MARPFETGPRRQTPEQQEMAKWEALEMNIPPDFPRLGELKMIRDKAKLVMSVIAKQRTKIDGGPAIAESHEQLKELYQKAIEIKAEAYLPSLAKKLNLPPGTAVDTALLTETDKVKDLPGFQSIGLKLESIVKGLSADPSSVRPGAPGNLYFTVFNGGPAVRFEQVQKSRDFLASLRRNLLPLQPSFTPLIDKLEDGLCHLDTVNPALTARNAGYTAMKNSKNKMEMKPVQLLAFLGAGFLAGLGLLHSIKEREMPRWPTLGWGGIAALAAFPELLKDGATRSAQTLASLNNPLTQTLVASGFGEEAFTEIQEARRNPKKLTVLKQLVTGTTPVTNAMIGMLTDQKETPLAKSLQKLSVTDVRGTLQMFGRAMPKGDQQLITSVLTGAPPPTS